MFKLRRKNLIYFSLGLLLVVSSALAPALGSPVLNFLKVPLKLSALAAREIKGLLFYHRNFIRNEKLQNQVQLLQQRLNALNEVYRENQRLQNLLSFKQKSAYKVIAARVVSRAADSWSCVLIIDKGRHQGIGRNMVVINYLGLVGRVAEAGQFSSKVMLMNDANFAVSGILQRSRQEGVVCGTMGQYLVMRYLPKECDVRVSDTVVTSGLTANYPKGLLVGTVIDVQEEFSGLSRLAIVKPAVDFSALEEVLVIIP